MDHVKTASPLFSHKIKMNDAWMKLPNVVTGMIAHGHGDVRYAHYGLDIHPSDSNHTIGSIAKLLHDLEEVPKSTSRALFTGSGTSPIFEAILQGKEICVGSLLPPDMFTILTMALPPKLVIQLDNAASDNKNRYIFCFKSLFVAHGLFREIQVNFLLVGHTRDDIDAVFGRWSMKLKENDYPTIPLFMKSFIDIESKLVIPHLIEEVLDFKGFIEDFIATCTEELVGHFEGQQLKFYMHQNGWPMMKYKIQCTDSDWFPRENGGIKLWKEDDNKKPILPQGEPKRLTPNPMRNRDDIVKGIAAFNHWGVMCEEDTSGEYRRKNEQLMKYWAAVRDALPSDIHTTSTLQDEF